MGGSAVIRGLLLAGEMGAQVWRDVTEALGSNATLQAERIGEASTADRAIASDMRARDHLSERIAAKFGDTLLDQFAERILSPPSNRRERLRIPQRLPRIWEARPQRRQVRCAGAHGGRQ